MTAVNLLESLKLFCADCLKDMMLPEKTKLGDEIQFRPLNIYKMNIPLKKGNEKEHCPFILIQVLSGTDESLYDAKCKCTVRFVIGAYSEDAENGSLYILNIIERLRIELLKKRNLDNQYELVGCPEFIIYPDVEINHFAGDMITEWELPAVYREVDYYENYMQD